ncbi:hypothetical protein KR074_001913, partial [Drosophila pseudoananassae]
MEEKVQPKFLLPSPKFDKPNGPSQANTHYLTPCGMTLLPRAKQPPPMYGARGSTVPAKFLPKEQNVPPPVPETPPIYECPPVPEQCYTCEMELANSQDMKRHLEQHEECPAENCDFAALHSILERHIEAHHITGSYKKVKKVWTAEDLAAWKAERRKKFPTAANVELARQAKEQRIKRGERLEASRSRFGRREDRERIQRGQNRQDSKARSRQKRKEHFLERKKTQKSTSEPIIQPSQPQAGQQEEDPSSIEIKKFQGTGQMTDYKHLKDKVKKEDNAIFGLVGMYGSDSEEESESDSEEIEEQNEDESPKDEELPNLKQSEESGSEAIEEGTEDEDPKCKEAKDIKESDDSPSPSTNVGVSENVSTAERDCSSDEAPEEEPIQKIQEPLAGTAQPDTEKAESSDEAPDEEPFQRVTETIKETVQQSTSSGEATKPKQPEKRPAPKRYYGLNYKRARRSAPQNTLLSKLLANDIIHERNVLLQCVRHVCQKNFFGIGQ